MKNIIVILALSVVPVMAQCDWIIDGSVDILDVVDIVDCILNDCFDGSQCDWNGDGSLDVADVVAVVDCILNNCWEEISWGCTDMGAYNFDENAYYDNGSCIYPGELLIYFDNMDEEAHAGQVWVTATDECSGFQLIMTGILLTDVYGGVDELPGEQISFSPATGTVLCFNFDNNFFPSGNYLLFNFTYSEIVDSEICIQDPVFSPPPESSEFDIILAGCYTFQQGLGCTDEDACNYNMDALVNDGSCLFNDCNGNCGGNAIEDDCGLCCQGETGIECSYWNSSWDFGGAYDCAGVCFGPGFIYDCAGCVPDGVDPDSGMEMDCNGDCFGNAIYNECGCVGGNTGFEIDYCYGCTDTGAPNYDPDATIDDGSCEYER